MEQVSDFVSNEVRMPIFQLESYDSFAVDGTEWQLVDMTNGAREVTIALAFTDTLMITITAPADQLSELAELVRIEQVR